MTITDSLFKDNATTGPFAPNFGAGGAVNVFDANLNINDSSFIGNNSNWTAAAISVEFQNNGSNTVYDANIDNSLVSNNHGAFEGAMTITSLGGNNSADLVTINNTHFINNYGGASGGAIDNDSINTHISNSYFLGNVSGGVGGAINSDQFFNNLTGSPASAVTISNSVFMDNTAQANPANMAAYVGSFSSPAFGAVLNGGGGGALSAEWGGVLNVSNSLLADNTALNGNGGAVLAGGGNLYFGSTAFATGGTANMTNDIIIGNSAQNGNGGGIASLSSFPTNYPTGVPGVNLQNSIVSLNTAAGSGGGVYMDQTSNTIQDNAIMFNFAESGSNVYGANSLINGEASNSPTAASDLQQLNIILGSVDDVVLL